MTVPRRPHAAVPGPTQWTDQAPQVGERPPNGVRPLRAQLSDRQAGGASCWGSRVWATPQWMRWDQRGNRGAVRAKAKFKEQQDEAGLPGSPGPRPPPCTSRHRTRSDVGTTPLTRMPQLAAAQGPQHVLSQRGCRPTAAIPQPALRTKRAALSSSPSGRWTHILSYQFLLAPPSEPSTHPPPGCSRVAPSQALHGQPERGLGRS